MNLNTIRTAAGHAAVSIPLQGESTRCLPVGVVGSSLTASPEVTLCPATDVRVVDTSASERATHLLLGQCNAERFAADGASSLLGMIVTPSVSQIAIMRAEPTIWFGNLRVKVASARLAGSRFTRLRTAGYSLRALVPRWRLKPSLLAAFSRTIDGPGASTERVLAVTTGPRIGFHRPILPQMCLKQTYQRKSFQVYGLVKTTS